MTTRFLKLGTLVWAVGLAGCTASLTDSGPDGTNGPSGGPNGGASNGGGGSTGTGGGVPVPPEVLGKLKLSGSPSYFRVVRLSNEQWTNSVQTALKLSAPPTLAEGFQDAVAGATDFTNNELGLDIDARRWSDYEAAAEKLAAQVAADPAQLSKLYSGTDGAGFIAAVGRRIYRRPLSATEASAYQKLFDSGPSSSGSLSAFAKGASLVLEAMLQSPHFLYRTELGAVGAPLSNYEMASKLSLWLRNSSPDDTLLDAAAVAGQLDTPTGVATLAQKMLDEPAAKTVMRQFHGEFLRFKKFADLSKVSVDGWDPAINGELAESSYLFFDRIFGQGLGVKDIFLSKTAFVGPLMAKFYEGNVAAPVSGLSERELGASRAGYFLQLPFLMLYARPDGPDPIHRGVTISLDVLCAPLGQFGGELPQLPPRAAGQTNRQRVDQHTSVCGAACHNNMINPLGFAFENFDGVGQYRETEVNGTEQLPIDASGSFAFVDGTKSYQNATDLMNVLATDKQSHLCYSKKLAGFALQRDIVESDYGLLAELSNVSATGSIKQIAVDLVQQDAFRLRSGGAK